MKAKSGFTLVEILIVVVILGILAAIVIPQFTQAGDEARENSTRADLQTVRCQIELYKIQHNDEYPGQGTGSTDFVTDMTTFTLVDGTPANPQAPGDDVFGPYLERVPSNPYCTGVGADPDAVKEAVDAPAAAGTEGWHFNTTTSAFHCNTTVGDEETW